MFPHLEECWGTPLTEKEQQLVSILELVRIEKHVPWSGINQWMEIKLSVLVENCLKTELIGHICRDSTAIEGREKPAKKLPKAKPVPRKKG